MAQNRPFLPTNEMAQSRHFTSTIGINPADYSILHLYWGFFYGSCSKKRRELRVFTRKYESFQLLFFTVEIQAETPVQYVWV